MTNPDPCREVVRVDERPRPLRARIIELVAGTELWHVGHANYPFASFDSRPGVSHRFTPLTQAGSVKGTLYAAATKEAAIAETLWRGLPLEGARLPYERAASRTIGTIRVERNLHLIELHDPGLRKLALRPSHLTDTSARCYEFTQAFAQALLDDHPSIDGLVWMSSRFNHDKAYLLLDHGTSPISPLSRTSCAEPRERDAFIEMCSRAGVSVTLASEGI